MDDKPGLNHKYEPGIKFFPLQLISNLGEKILCFHGPLLYEAKVDISYDLFMHF